MIYLKALGFLIVVPGIVAGFLPWLILQVSGVPIELVHGYPRLIAETGLAIGALIYLSCVWHFAHRGRGTLSPSSPPQRLVLTGVYRYVRNPMYVCAAIVLASEALLFSSLGLWVYAVVAVAGYAIFVVSYEEPQLRRRFGRAYEEYVATVPRWVPRLRASERGHPAQARPDDRSR